LEFGLLGQHDFMVVLEDLQIGIQFQDILFEYGALSVLLVGRELDLIVRQV
jgi:hypothetical protein